MLTPKSRPARWRIRVSTWSATRLPSRLALLALLLALGACASLPEHVERPVSKAQDGTKTALGAIAQKNLPGDPLLTVSGFRLISSGAYGLDARLALAKSAQQTLDVQYYLIGNDETGKQFFAALRDAAVRGVRVRLLIDDLYTIGEDDLLSGLAAYPNVEIRLFNPFPFGRMSMSTRLVMSLSEIERVNRRMHNKLFIADNEMAISGGRNIANEYFTRAGADSFVDLDVLSVGPVVKDLSAVFDKYWNSDVVYPLASIVSAPSDPGDARAAFEKAVAAPPDDPQLAATDFFGHKPVSEDLKTGDMELHQAIAEVLSDSPQKAAGLNADNIKGTVTLSVDDEIDASKSDILIVSPYFVPGPGTMRRIKAAIARGVNVMVVTNSLAATDVPLVYAGYAKERVGLLKLGVKIYELSQEVAKHVKLSDFRSQLGHLHAKALVFDRQRVFVGSMNMDDRSAHENTETGLMLESQTFAKEVRDLVERDVARSAYEVRLVDGKVHWFQTVDGKVIEFDTEQGVSPWTELELDVLGPLAPNELL